MTLRTPAKELSPPVPSENDPRPLLAVTMGDPAGVGPEVIVRAWSDPRVHGWCRPLAIGHPRIFERAVDLIGLPMDVQEIAAPEEAVPSPTAIPCLKAVDDAALGLPACQADARGGQAAYDALVAAARFALAGRVAAITTAPLNKAALWKAGHEYPGHTELLAELCGVGDFAMMLYLAPDEQILSPAGLGVVHVTLHTALRRVFEQLSGDAILSKIRLADGVMRGLRRSAPRIGVCALNPHAGEEGLFGDEEQTLIAPAVEQARREGIDAHGPYPTDTLMVRARAGEFDGVVAMYHDQGHIALKLLGFHRAVNVTLGLPIIRTSVAHGTAFDRAWQGVAEAGSMVEAMRVASSLAGGVISPACTSRRRS
ncbi:MAG TPA: 4-hydroxythreonine-4-phosphate dehydrogenase PdxA [Pirellulales bacterium]|nr:4-hydroxythreonine-4-phosphate dehydrogenase PdxA [Pirellulales bacterium]